MTNTNEGLALALVRLYSNVGSSDDLLLLMNALNLPDSLVINAMKKDGRRAAT